MLFDLNFQDSYNATIRIYAYAENGTLFLESEEEGLRADVELSPEDAKELLANLQNTYPLPKQRFFDESATPTTVFSKDTGDPRSDWNLSALREAARLGLGAKFLYRNQDGQRNPRVLSLVTDVLETSAGFIIAVGQDENRDDYRTFRLDRIEDYVVVTPAPE